MKMDTTNTIFSPDLLKIGADSGEVGLANVVDFVYYKNETRIYF